MQGLGGGTVSRAKKIVFFIVLIVIVAAIGGAGYVYRILTASLPADPGTIAELVAGESEVYRDARGVPHIRAENTDDLLFIQGYIHADERLWQMEFHRRVVGGRLAEALGADLAGADRFLRTIGLRRVARRVIEKTSPEGLAAMEQYARGVNARILEGRLPPELRILGIEPEPWELVDTAGVLALMAYELGTNWQEESIRKDLKDHLPPELYEEVLPPYAEWETPAIWKKEQSIVPETPFSTVRPPESLSEIEPFLPRLGSNSWVIRADRWGGDHALLANDPHLSIGLPVIWFENRLVAEDGLRVYGWSIPGAPGVVIGHNDRIAWGMTNIGDTQDLFAEQRHPEEPFQFQWDEDWYEAGVIEEEIPVKGHDAPEMHRVIITRNGPLISENPPVSLKWTAHRIETSTVDAILRINRAGNWEQFKDALSSFSAPVQNIVYADTDGNIGFKTAGMLPVRKKGRGLEPKPGWDSAYGWEGFIPAEDLPELFNPPRGFIATANHKVAGDGYPHTIAIDDASPYRMVRIMDVLSDNADLSLADMKALQTDRHNRHAEERLPLFLARTKAHGTQFPDRYADSWKTALALLQQWSRSPESLPEKAAPAIYARWYLAFMEDVFRDKMGDELYFRFIDKGYVAFKALDYLLEKEESAWFDEELGFMMARSLQHAVDELSAAMGPDPEAWRWKDLQTISFEHVMGQNRLLAYFFNRGPFPYGGDYETVDRAAYSLNNPFDVTFAAGLRFIVEMDANGIRSHAVLAGGQSGHFLSANYDDQIETWLEGGYYRAGFAK